MAAEPRWQRVEDARAFLNARGRVRVGDHEPRHVKRLSWPYCIHCGLLYLKNDVTRAALRKKCVSEE